MLDFSRNSDHLYRLYITGDMMLRDGLEDIPRRYPDMDFGLIHTGWHDLLAHGGHDDGPDGFGANGTIFGRHGIQSRDLASPRMRFSNLTLQVSPGPSTDQWGEPAIAEKVWRTATTD